MARQNIKINSGAAGVVEVAENALNANFVELYDLAGGSRSFASRAAAVSTWAAFTADEKTAVANGTIWTADGLEYERDSAATMLSDLAGWKPHGEHSFAHHNVDLTGATDDRSKVSDALAYANVVGGNLLIPAGIVNFALTGTAFPVSADNVRLVGEGEGRSILRAHNGTGGYAFLFNMSADGFRIDNATIEVTSDATLLTSIMQGGGAKWGFSGTKFKSDIADNGSGLATHAVYVIKQNDSADLGHVVFDNCDFEKIHDGILKANAATGTTVDISYRGCRSLDCWMAPVGVNSPGGPHSDFSVTGGSFKNTTGHADVTAFIGIASGDRINITGASFEGPTWTAVYFEEEIHQATLSNLNATIDGDFFGATANNVSGSYHGPSYLSLTNFTARQTGTRDHDGIRLTYDAKPIGPTNYVTIGDGVLENFQYGMTVGMNRGDKIRAHDLTFVGCEYGLYLAKDGFPNIERLTFDSCDTAILAGTGGVVCEPSFIDCTRTHEVTNGRLTLKDPKFQFQELTTGSSSNIFPRLVRGLARAAIQVLLDVYNNNSNRSVCVTDISWDGTTAAATNVEIENAGGILTAVNCVTEAASATISAAGTGYTVGDTLTVSGGTKIAGGNSAQFTVDTVGGSGEVTSVTLANDGGEYSAAPSSPASTTGGTGSGCTLSLTTRQAIIAVVYSSATRTIRLDAVTQGVAVVQGAA